jgi:hypothetical protein
MDSAGLIRDARSSHSILNQRYPVHADVETAGDLQSKSVENNQIRKAVFTDVESNSDDDEDDDESESTDDDESEDSDE